MKRLVLLGEGHGEVSGFPVLARKLIHLKNAQDKLYVDKHVIRAHNPSGLIKWNKDRNLEDASEWIRFLRIAARTKDLGGVLALFDGDLRNFPAGKQAPFCAATAAIHMAKSAEQAGAGKVFSLAVVFACVEYETWLVAGAGKVATSGEQVLFPGIPFPGGDPESHGKGWIERHHKSYRPTRDQKPLTELLDLKIVRERKLRSFTRLEHAFDQLLTAAESGVHVSTPG